ncbi:hypothetical protein D7V20_09310 [Acinetobacter rongchengensis]|uniref:Uncharacterized protein n=2 Tax=Acinetobacter rongchengensis TaxID=2419601 RepID=A0A3A8ESW2_9GAMM|nr:hypothetical protein D7V20_09310 [Acinetobacter rongchengensis]
MMKSKIGINMWLLKSITTFALLFISIIACSEVDEKIIDKKDVDSCSIDFDEVDFCTQENLKKYNGVLQKNIANFNGDKYLLNFKYKKYIYFAVIDLKGGKVYSFPASITLLERGQDISFSKDKNIFCINGNFNQYQNSYRNVRSCYFYNNGNFNLKSRDEIKNKSNNQVVNGVLFKNNVVTVNIPNDSEFYSKCRGGSSQKKCQDLSNKNDYFYPSSEIGNIIVNVDKFIGDQNIKKINFDTFRFISNGEAVVYSIGEKYYETDDGLSSNFYLIKLKPKVEVIDLGSKYYIDSRYNLSYVDISGVKKNIKLEF